jgi:hypothetical protein
MMDAADVRVKEKMDKYWENCKAKGIKFMPLVWESYGGFHKNILDLVKLVGKRLASRRKGRSAQEEIAQLFQSISVALHRGNGKILASRSIG